MIDVIAATALHERIQLHCVSLSKRKERTMKYNHVLSGTFLQRPNRFIAHVLIDSKEEICHVKNTGRCHELLIPGCTVYCAISDNPQRKTKFDLIVVE